MTIFQYTCGLRQSKYLSHSSILWWRLFKKFIGAVGRLSVIGFVLGVLVLSIIIAVTMLYTIYIGVPLFPF